MTDEQKDLCAAWVSAPNRKWQTLNRSQWKYQFHEKTLVRYVEEAKMDEDIVPLLLEYLSSEDSKQTLQLYGQSLPAGDWTPIRAWYETSNKAVGNVRAVRLYQAFSTQPDHSDMFFVENGCAYRVWMTYYYNKASVPDATKSTSGVSYHVGNVQQNPETGLYSYTIEKRERVKQDVPLYLTQTTVYEDRSEEMHLGVRGSESSGGKKASVSKGTVTTRKVTKNADCTHDVHNTVTKAKPVSGAAVEYVRTLHGTTKIVTDRNQQSAVAESGIQIGERRSARRTDEDLYDNTVTTRKPIPAGKVETNERTTVFAKSSSVRENVSAKSGLPKRTVPAAKDGKSHGVNVQRFDDGTADVVTTTTEEKQVLNAVREVRCTLRGKTTTVTHRSQPTPSVDSGVVPGETRTSRRTDGGRYDNTVSVTEGRTGTFGSSCTDSGAMHEDTTTRTVRAAEAEIGGHAQSDIAGAQVNVIVERSVRMNDDGDTADVTVRRRRLKTQRGNGGARQGGGERMVTTRRVENAQGTVNVSAGTNEKVEFSNVPNGANGYNTVVTTTRFFPFDSQEKKIWEDDENECLQRSYRNQPSMILPDKTTPGQKHVSVTKNDHGTWDGGYSIVKPKTVAGGIRIIERDKDVTFASARKYGEWKWTNGLNVTGVETRAWEYRRICTMRVRYTGLTSSGANAIKSQLDSLFTRSYYTSEWNPNGMPGHFDTVNGGLMRMAKVEKFHVSGKVWGVLLDVNEVSTRMSLSPVSSPSSMFGYESAWSYAIPSGGVNVG